MHRQGQIGYANAGNNGCAKNCSEMVLKKVHNKRRTQKCAQRRAGKAYIRRTDLREAYGNVERRTEMCRGVQIRAEAYRYEQRRTGYEQRQDATKAYSERTKKVQTKMETGEKEAHGKLDKMKESERGKGEKS
ncbi:hypothetical protein POVCU1_056410 [Plasmodium ovale curtisi]|uniref:Uncharacterized protein n=1 Tax=Plasmodium ovale curtisi TaxID=864141 RepID=A0A1A8X3X4_PLAOA|nr:hypothetical protein POVCU1_056410 [Plasmodium ovale curtisi]